MRFFVPYIQFYDFIYTSFPVSDTNVLIIWINHIVFFIFCKVVNFFCDNENLPIMHRRTIYYRETSHIFPVSEIF